MRGLGATAAATGLRVPPKFGMETNHTLIAHTPRARSSPTHNLLDLYQTAHFSNTP
eukprot:m.364818 g.364818  ORF g.364818 m.364818 type:complete len:56 (+) comp28080_c0_seq27:5960-6127(+)